MYIHYIKFIYYVIYIYINFVCQVLMSRYIYKKLRHLFTKKLIHSYYFYIHIIIHSYYFL